MSTKLADLRRVYDLDKLSEESSGNCPFALFEHWLAAALTTETLDPNAMTLATVDASGQPRARIVLLKGFSPEGWVFYTNYLSDKGQELALNPKCSLLFWWEALERQVRIEGRAVQLSAESSKAYYVSRPRASQLGAWVSPQSQVIQNRDILINKEQELEQQFAGQEVLPKPDHWGGYLIKPTLVEFWQGQPSRLHDRIRFTRNNFEQPWLKERLAP